MATCNISITLLKWYKDYKRDLPWRRTKEPYAIWISEIILQQTRVRQGLPYYQRFIDRFPDVKTLANSTEEEILHQWQGLGYYSRARNMHRCAKIILDQYKGYFPDSFKELIKFPGIGSYTAAAIASIAFGEPVAVLDGNVIRVLTRLFGIEDNISESRIRKRILMIASKLIDRDNPGDFNQAIMEFGAVQCIPLNPNCNDCPLQNQCKAFLYNLQNKLPVKSKRNSVKNRYFHYFIIYHQNKILMKKRYEKDIWEGLYDFYLHENDSIEKIEFKTIDGLPSKLLDSGENIEFISSEFIHQLSHQKIHARFYHLPVKQIENVKNIRFYKNHRFYNILNISKLPKSILISNYLEEVFI